MSEKVTPHPRNPMHKAAEFYKRLMIMAEARELNETESELVVALMLASHMVKAGIIHELQTAVALRIHRQAVEFVELGMMVNNQEGAPEPPAA